jgi:hypothetical protein
MRCQYPEPHPDAPKPQRLHWDWGAYAPRVCGRTPRPPKRPTMRAYPTLCSTHASQRSTRGASNRTRGGGAPLLCPTLLAESGRRLPHSKTLRVCPCARSMRQLLDCACPLALSITRNSLVQDNARVPPALDDAPHSPKRRPSPVRGGIVVAPAVNNCPAPSGAASSGLATQSSLPPIFALAPKEGRCRP